MKEVLLVLVGAIIGAAPTIIAALINQKAEREKHLRQLAVELALAEYRADVEWVRRREKKTLHPPASHIAPAYAGVKGFMSGDLSPEGIHKTYDKIEEVTLENAVGIKTRIPGK